MEKMDERDNARYGCILLPRKVYAYVMALSDHIQDREIGCGASGGARIQDQEIGWRRFHSRLRSWMKGPAGGACDETSIIKDPVEATCDHSVLPS